MCEIIEHKLGKTKRNLYLKRDREKEKAGVDVKIFRVAQHLDWLKQSQNLEQPIGVLYFSAMLL